MNTIDAGALGRQLTDQIGAALKELKEDSPTILKLLADIQQDLAQAVVSQSPARQQQCFDQMQMLAAVAQIKTSHQGWILFQTITKAVVGAAKDGLMLGLKVLT
jgi:hypothetical protein